MPKSADPGAGSRLEAAVVRRLTRRRLTLAVAESCTGGGVANLLTNVPGASRVFLGGVVAYSNAVKQKFLGVRARTLARHGAVSGPVARQMAEGARKKFKADYALSVTGIAGPGGGTAATPLGTVFIALAEPLKTVVIRKRNSFRREEFKRVTAKQALKLLLTRLK